MESSAPRPTPSTVNRLALLVVSGRQSSVLMQRLTGEGFIFTQMDSLGGWINEPMVSLICGLPASRVDTLLKLIEQYCQPYDEYIPVQMNIHGSAMPVPLIEARVGGALVYIFPIEQFHQV